MTILAKGGWQGIGGMLKRAKDHTSLIYRQRVLAKTGTGHSLYNFLAEAGGHVEVRALAVGLEVRLASSRQMEVGS